MTAETRERLLADQQAMLQELQERIAEVRRLEGAINYNRMLLQEASDEQPAQPTAEVHNPSL